MSSGVRHARVFSSMRFLKFLGALIVIGRGTGGKQSYGMLGCATLNGEFIISAPCKGKKITTARVHKNVILNFMSYQSVNDIGRHQRFSKDFSRKAVICVSVVASFAYGRQRDSTLSERHV